jgi:hypothetical protein
MLNIEVDMKRQDFKNNSKAVQKTKKRVSILELLHWAFQREHAFLVFSDYAANPGHVSAFDPIYMMMQQVELGVRVDTSSGGWRRHDDAEQVADALIALSDRAMAVTIADLARSGRCPDWMPGAVPRIMPREWGRANRYGTRAKTAVCGTVETIKRGRTVRTEIRYCPVTITPTPAQIASARRAYLYWWGALFDLSLMFQVPDTLTSHQVTNIMPPRSPWKKDIDC